MELGATKELGDGRGGQLGEEDTPYIVQEQIQPLSTNSACVAWYYRAGDAVLPQGHTVLPQYYRPCSRNQSIPDAMKQRAVEPLARYYCSPLLYYRKAGIDQIWDGTDI